MDYTITAIFVVVDDLLKAMQGGQREDVRRQMSDAEVATTALCAALYFYCVCYAACVPVRFPCN